MADILQSDGNPNRSLNESDYNKEGEIVTVSGDLALVTGSASRVESFIVNKQWALLWRDADLLYQSPRPMSTYENTYILEPNVQRFTVAKVVNAIVPQLYKGLFYEDPPMVLRPRPGTSQNITDAKTALFAYLLDQCKFKRETKWGLENKGLFGTGIFKWGIERVEVESNRRVATSVNVPVGPPQVDGSDEVLVTDEQPKIETKTRVVPRPFFCHRPLDKVLVDPKLLVGDIREADFVIDVWHMDFYQLKTLMENNTDSDKKPLEGWSWPEGGVEGLKKLWMPASTANVAQPMATEQAVAVDGAVHHAEKVNVTVSPDLLFKKLEILEYWDKGRKILVLDRKKVIYTGKNPFNQIPFLSSNWWNRPKAFYGMGLGLIVGQNQRVDQGSINAILKILSYGVNPIYLRKRDSSQPTQMIRTGLGKILTVDTEVDKAYRLLETPKVPTEVWSALSESEKATESSSGADQMLVQGSSSGPRTSMGRTAGGAGILANASATRLDGPLDNFIEQVFTPFLYILDELIFRYVSDAEIKKILGEELGTAFQVDMQAFHEARMEYEVLAGASLAAKRTMAQSLTLITQMFENPQIQQNLAEINEEYIDFKPILNMWMESSEWKNRADIIKKMTPEMKQRMQQKSAAAQAASRTAQTAQLNDQKFAQKQQLEDQSNDNRIKRDLVREAFRNNSSSEVVNGSPSTNGLGPQDTVI